MGKNKPAVAGMVIAFPTAARLLLSVFRHQGIFSHWKCSEAALWIISVVSVKCEGWHGRGDKEIKHVTGEQKNQQL